MKQRKLTIGHLLGLLALSAAAIIATGSGRTTNASFASVGNYEFDLDEYYSVITEEKGEPLLGQIHDLMVSTHRTYTAYEDNKNPQYVYRMDPGDDEEHVRDFYTQSGSTLSVTWDGNNPGTWNREHVWPQASSAGLWGKTGGGGDVHHIRPEENRLNNERGNKSFGIVTNHRGSTVYAKDTQGKDVTDYPGGYSNANTFEPIDSCKGDVARIILYVYTHYNSYPYVGGTTNGTYGQSTYFGNLPITNVIRVPSEKKEDCFKLLLDWSESDPVDEKERIRNEAASAMTGVRNVFIDHPEYALAIWGEEEEPIESSSVEPSSSNIQWSSSEVFSSFSELENLSEETSIEETTSIDYSSQVSEAESVTESREKSHEESNSLTDSESESIASSNPPSSGCGGSISAGGITFILIGLLGLVLFKKRIK